MANAAAAASSLSPSSSSAAAWPFVTHAESTITVRFSGNHKSTTPPADEESSSSSSPRFAVGYWSIRGLAAPIRMMLCAAQQDHTVYLYDCLERSQDDNGTTEESAWSVRYLETEKERLRDTYGNPFMNLPYIVDAPHQLLLTQSNACLQYVGECLNRMGSSSTNNHPQQQQRAQCVQLLCELYDLRNVMVNYAYADPPPAEPATAAADCIAAARVYWIKFEQHLMKQQQQQQHRSNSFFLVGDQWNAPDFGLFEMVDQFDQLGRFHELPDGLVDFPHIRAFQTAFAALPYVLYFAFLGRGGEGIAAEKERGTHYYVRTCLLVVFSPPTYCSENQFYLHSIFHQGLPMNYPTAHFGSALGPATYQPRVTKASWTQLGHVTLTADDATTPCRQW